MSYGILVIAGLILLTDLCDMVSQLLLKHSINTLDPRIDGIGKIWGFVMRLIRAPKVWIGFCFSTVSLAVWLFVLSKSELNFAYSLDSMRYVLIALASMLVLKERIGVVRWLGIVCVVVGIFMVAAG